LNTYVPRYETSKFPRLTYEIRTSFLTGAALAYMKEWKLHIQEVWIFGPRYFTLDLCCHFSVVLTVGADFQDIYLLRRKLTQSIHI
jgi:hypothetical protein